ncbi:MAG: sigma-54-dependent Fis family transcriptional regulator, partial [Gammaproteobacteria bacterium]
MTQEYAILVVSNDDIARHELGAISRFVGEHCEVIDEAGWQSAAQSLIEEGPGLKALILDEDCHPQIVGQMMELDSSVPVLAIGDPDVSDLPEDVQKRVIARLQRPLSYTKFTDSLYRAQIFKDHHSRDRARQQQRELQLFRSLVGTSRAICRVR